MVRYLLVLSCLFCITPLVAHASVVINEIAWMGTSVSANDEWIELYNNGGTAVSLDGWTLSDGVSLEIPLTGSVSPGQYAVLERTDDSSAPETAFLIYTGALANDGRTLTLTRADATIEDRVTGGENWESIGGDNISKNTAQRSTGGWITANPTPGRANQTVHIPPESDGPALEENDTTTSSGSSANSSGRRAQTSEKIKEGELQLEMYAPRTGYVNQEILFEVAPFGVTDRLSSFRYEWSFGDLGHARGEKVKHSYAFPGEYVVVVEGGHAIHNATQRHIITILSVELSIERTSDGLIHIRNMASHEVDLSEYTIRGDVGIVVPKNTMLLPGTTLTIDNSRIEQGTEKMIALYDRQNVLVASHVPNALQRTPQAPGSPPQFARTRISTQPEQAVPTASIKRPVAEAPQEETVLAESAGSDETTSEPPTNTDTPKETTQVAAAASAADDVAPVNMLPYAGLAGLLLLSAVAVYAGRTK